jgi:myo-inositol-1(or 4)-monophosphatase
VSALDDAALAELERVAVELARLAAAEIQTFLGRELAIRYKGAGERAGGAQFRDPASEADERIERLIRDRLAERYPDHGVVGEEMSTVAGGVDQPVWVIDPIDGTANFVNGLPLFAASIGIMHQGLPVVGALWCSTSHTLRHGVYHARRGGRVCFDESPVTLIDHADLRRHLAGEPDPTVGEHLHWEVRKTGSASIECAFVAAGLLRVARFAAPYLWDVAGGIALVQAAGLEVREHVSGAWRPLAPVEAGALGTWQRPLIIGERDAVVALIDARAR